ncbi:hypothetical protein EJP67_29790 [Variovorax guangxiensis]|uniref:Uncharacterized protein n=1 Tax=Variovorax guangxiensis TaxID=1775474 RepID=A0A433MTX4_9BURK|nr:hypothetical protein [Variovorax guangxiensis]RUR71244.1 hypothetical protein EJP67_29790 [Variovorax guangxiensis]
MTVEVPRFIDLTAPGALACVSGPVTDIPGRLLRALLLRKPYLPWHGEELARLFPDEPASMMARTLFRLHHEGCIEVSLTQPAPYERLGASLTIALQPLIDEGASSAALFDQDGFVIAQAGGGSLLPDDPLAALPTDLVRLHVGEGAMSTVYGLALHGIAIAKCSSLAGFLRCLFRIRATHACL